MKIKRLKEMRKEFITNLLLILNQFFDYGFIFTRDYQDKLIQEDDNIQKFTMT